MKNMSKSKCCKYNCTICKKIINKCHIENRYNNNYFFPDKAKLTHLSIEYSKSFIETHINLYENLTLREKDL